VKDTVLEEKRFDLAKKHIKDIPQEFEKSVKVFEENRRQYSDPNAGIRLRPYNENRLVTDALQLIDLAITLATVPPPFRFRRRLRISCRILDWRMPCLRRATRNRRCPSFGPRRRNRSQPRVATP
jgi:hypothetical protein